eukprot:g75563.t1
MQGGRHMSDEVLLAKDQELKVGFDGKNVEAELRISMSRAKFEFKRANVKQPIDGMTEKAFRAIEKNFRELNAVKELREIKPGQDRALYSLKIPKLEEKKIRLHYVKTRSEDESYPIDEFNKRTKYTKKICVIGTYKVGKSTILNLLTGKQDFMSSSIKSTKGLEMLLLGENLFVDTEGYNQPLDVIEPYVKRDFITSHLKYWCNSMVIVVDRITMQDLQLLDYMTDLFRTSNTMDLTVLHNVKTITSVQALEAYAERIISNLRDMSSGVGSAGGSEDANAENAEHHLDTSVKQHSPLHFEVFHDTNKSVSHHFIGSLQHAAHWRGSFEAFVKTIKVAKRSTTEFGQSVRLAATEVYSKYYDYDNDALEVKISAQESNTFEVIFSGPHKRVTQGEELNLRGRSRLSYHFAYDRVEKVLFVILSLAEFYVSDVTVPTDHSILVKGYLRELNRSYSSTCIHGIISEIIHLPCRVMTTDKYGPVWKHLGHSGFGSILIEMTPNEKQLNLEGIPKATRAIFNQVDKLDPVWEEIKRYQAEMAKQGTRRQSTGASDVSGKENKNSGNRLSLQSSSSSPTAAIATPQLNGKATKSSSNASPTSVTTVHKQGTDKQGTDNQALGFPRNQSMDLHLVN